MYADEQTEDGDDDYDASTTSRPDADKTDRVKTSASSVHATDGIDIRVVRGSITEQKVHYFVF